MRDGLLLLRVADVTCLVQLFDMYAVERTNILEDFKVKALTTLYSVLSDSEVALDSPYTLTQIASVTSPLNARNPLSEWTGR